MSEGTSMSNHPVILGLRFILEMLALLALTLWGWTQQEGWMRIVLAVLLPLLAALAWGVFAVPGDPSRSGKTVVRTRGWIRLLIEGLIFGLATWAYFDIGYSTFGILYGLTVLSHYILSLKRVQWLLKT